MSSVLSALYTLIASHIKSIYFCKQATGQGSFYDQGIAGLDCSIQPDCNPILVDWIVIDNLKSKSDFGFGLD